MRPGFLNTCLASLYFLIASAASPRDKFRDAAEHLPEVVKSVTQDLSKEPSCDELRAMWRFSKRQSRAAESTNEIPTYRDPFAYNVWEDHASIRSVGGGKMRRPLVYGRLVHNGYQRPRVQEAPVPERIRGFEDFARMFNTGHMPKAHTRRKPTTIRLVGGNSLGQMQIDDAQPTSFQKLKQMIQLERARELHEQKLSEESAARDALQYQRMIQDASAGATGLVPYSHGHRSRPQLDPVVNFPDVLTPSNDYYTNNYNYMQRSSYPDPLTRLAAASRILVPVTDLQLLDTERDFDSFPRDLRILQPQNQPTFISSQAPSFIDEEISRLATDPPLKARIVRRSPLEKSQPLENLEEEPGLKEEDLPPLIVYLQPGYSIDQQEIPWLNGEDVRFELVNYDDSIFQTGSDLELLSEPDFTNHIASDAMNSDSDEDGLGFCPKCWRLFAKTMGYFQNADISELPDTQYMENDDVFDENGNQVMLDSGGDKIKTAYQEDGEETADTISKGNYGAAFNREDRKQQSLIQNSSIEINNLSESANIKEDVENNKPEIELQENVRKFEPSSRHFETRHSLLRSHHEMKMPDYEVPVKGKQVGLKEATKEELRGNKNTEPSPSNE